MMSPECENGKVRNQVTIMENERLALHPRGTSGFTLIELLVVVSIISLMMSIMLPSLTNARQQGNRVACMSNMRGLTQAWLMYAFEHDDELCSPRTDWDLLDEGHWVVDGDPIPGNEIGGTADAIRAGALWPHAGQTLDIYRCKSDSSDTLRNYSISMAMNGPGHGIDFKKFRRWHEITQSSGRLVFIDAACSASWIDGPFELRWTPNGPHWPLSDHQSITARHSNGCNISLADGHCEYWKYRDPRTVSHANGDPQAHDTVDNPDIERAMDLLGWQDRLLEEAD
jgi:prepilin-type N-terminal cleavage/methylation domain-containing protein/prepilin-type processing-associated H-X9-DG protein